jgi:hypothetical protein
MNASCEFLEGLPGSSADDAVPRTIQIMYYLKKQESDGEHSTPLLVSEKSYFIQGTARLPASRPLPTDTATEPMVFIPPLLQLCYANYY